MSNFSSDFNDSNLFMETFLIRLLLTLSVTRVFMDALNNPFGKSVMLLNDKSKLVKDKSVLKLSLCKSWICVLLRFKKRKLLKLENQS